MMLVAAGAGFGLTHCVETRDDGECERQRLEIVQMRSGCDCGEGSDGGGEEGGYGDGGDAFSDAAGTGCGCRLPAAAMDCEEVALEYAKMRSSCTCEEPPRPDPDPEEEPVCDEDTPVTLFLSPDDSNSMSSPVQAREAVLTGHGIFPVRVWEFLNYYSFDYPVAERGQVTVRAEMRAIDEDSGYYLQIGVGSAKVDDDSRAPINLTLVLDESGSMNGSPIELLKESCRAIAAQLRDGDVISMVTWDTDNAVLLAGYNVKGPNDPTLLQRINDIEASGGTDLHGGLLAGYDLARDAFDKDRINRIVLISDGGANVGVTSEDLIGAEASDEDAEGIYMVGAGVGAPTSYNDTLMDVVTDLGKGASVFIPDEVEAWKVFGDDFVNTFDVAVRDVQVQVDFPPGFEIAEFSGEEYSPDPQEIEPQHLAPNDSMVFLQRLETCAPELVSDESELTVTVRYKDAHTFEARELSVTRSFGELLSETSPQLEKGLAIFKYAQLFRGEVTKEEAFAQLEAAELLLPGDPDLAEVRMVLEAMP